MRPPSATELEGSQTDPDTGLITKGEDAVSKEPLTIGIMV